MEPALRPGDYLVAHRGRRPLVGDVVVFPHPDREALWLVKRVKALAGPDGIEVASDNAGVTMADSRTFGPVPVEGMFRVVFRYWPWRRMGRL